MSSPADQVMSAAAISTENGTIAGARNYGPNIQFLVLDFPSDFIRASRKLETPFLALVRRCRPSCIVWNLFFTWTADLARSVGVPRLGFNVSTEQLLLRVRARLAGAAPALRRRGVGLGGVSRDRAAGPGRAHPLPDSPPLRDGEERDNRFVRADMGGGDEEPWSDNEQLLRAGAGLRRPRQIVLPVSMATIASNIGSKPRNPTRLSTSVSVVSATSLLRNSTKSQSRSSRATAALIIWVVKKKAVLKDDLVERTMGLIIRGWAPQVMILNHPAVGGFVTHCGWNSVLEGILAGVPMITWPFFADQFYNEKLVTEVLGAGVGVGNRWSWVSWESENREVVGWEKIEKVIRSGMGDGETAKRVKGKVQELRELGKKAMEIGGSSYDDLSRLLMDLESICF
ncbi:hypothetical protein H6P81_020575 [Aristolochia fimbriata]|uniref:Glycosyltransferase n=1 Tax=Aristolochia fimbriata TaxID=158543 RepID=A0AAV7DWL5_ARIFI|nr:hypothetical protein H6P81_020575 [Aristolochia fimbriata]